MTQSGDQRAKVKANRSGSFFDQLGAIGRWFPLLWVLTGLGAVSFLDANRLVPVDLPGWVHGVLELYRGARDHVIAFALGKGITHDYGDLAVGGVCLGTIILRRILSFALSTGGFVLLVVTAWIALRKFA